MHDNKLPERFFYQLATQASDRMMEGLPGEEELSRRLAFSPAFEQKMQLFLADPRPAVQNYRSWRVLAAAAAVLALLIAAMMSVSAVRQAVFKLFTTIYEKYIVVMFMPEDETLRAPELILDFREPNYVPPGFERASEEKLDFIYKIKFVNAEELELTYQQDVLDPHQYFLDIESTEEKEHFEMNGTAAMYQIQEGIMVMIWTDNVYAYKICGAINYEQALFMAQSVK